MVADKAPIRGSPGVTPRRDVVNPALGQFANALPYAALRVAAKQHGQSVCIPRQHLQMHRTVAAHRSRFHR